MINLESMQGPSAFLMMTDTALVEEVLKGKTAYFELLIRRQNQALYRVARSFGFNHQDAQDLLQETHIRAYEKLSQFKGNASYKTWITKIMVHKCMYKLNYGYDKHEVITDQPLILNQPICMNQSKTPDDDAVNKELRLVLEKSVEQLPAIYRSVFVLRQIEGFSVKETAAFLNISEINVKVRFNRAKAMLQKQIETVYSKADIYSFNLIYCDVVVERVFRYITNGNRTVLFRRKKRQ